MKTMIFMAALLAAGFLSAGFQSKSPVSPETEQTAQDTAAFPADVEAILKNSCVACHGEGGKAIALSKLKLSEWNGYTAEKKAQKAGDICKEVTGASMPPKGYLKNNPGAALTSEQIDALCAWSKSMQ
jgi:mono/diheme cytochrome c family protein